MVRLHLPGKTVSSVMRRQLNQWAFPQNKTKNSNTALTAAIAFKILSRGGILCSPYMFKI